MKYLQVSICTTHKASDIVSLILLEAGSDGVSIKDKHDFEELLRSDIIWDYVENDIMDMSDERVFVTGYFDENFDVSKIYSELDSLRLLSEIEVGSLETSCELIDSCDWENEWRKYYQPIIIGKIVIVPKWIKRDADEHIPVLMDPGMAFGTGSHETTGMCIRLLQGENYAGKTAVDIGCGSGILGISALKLGADKCYFTDIDKQAIDATTANVGLNNVGDRAVIALGDLADNVVEKVDYVFANITADVLLRLADAIDAILKPNGKIFISGLINSRADEVCDYFSLKYKLVQRIRDGEWQAMEFCL